MRSETPHTLPIQNIVAELQLTSRALRHWESKGLITSERDPESGWRCYTTSMVTRIRLIAILRRLNLPLADVERITNNPTPANAADVIGRHIETLNAELEQQQYRLQLLKRVLQHINQAAQSTFSAAAAADRPVHSKSGETLFQLLNTPVSSQEEKEDSRMHTQTDKPTAFRIVNLPPMRTAAHEVRGSNPEDQALNPLLAWVEEQKLMGTARIFGYNTTAYEPGDAEYGWGACITIPDDVKLPSAFQEKFLPGGTYAALDSSHEIYDSWQALSGAIETNNVWRLDQQRLCLEEHIPSADPDATVGSFYLNLLAPISKR